MADNFVFHGFTRILFLNGHGGNIVPSQQVVFEIRQKHRHRSDLLLLASTYWTLGSKPNEGTNIRQHRMGHACEWETSMMLRIRPDLVHNHTSVEEVPFGNPFEPANRGWITKDRTAAGHIGNPKEATAEKGELIFAAFTRDVIALLERVIKWDGKSWDG
jgi:creatinine amidohydrolase